MIATFVNWNFERRPPQSQLAVTMVERIVAQRPDVICLTEAHDGSTASMSGHEIADRGPTWSNNRRDGERLVPLWSPSLGGAMLAALDVLRIVTGGPLIGGGKPTIDHVAHTPDCAAGGIRLEPL